MPNATKHFTPKEANQTLPLVKKIVDDILQTGNQVRDLSRQTQTGELNSEIRTKINKLESHFKELEQVGCFYKDWNFTLGLVDFPAIINGKEVLLCWRSDEPEVRFYHTQEDGYTGRRPIPEDLLVGNS